MDPTLQRVKNRLFAKKNKGTITTDIIELCKDLSCLDSIIGKEFVVKNAQGNVVYTITQKPITFSQLNILMNEAHTVRQRYRDRWVELLSKLFGGKRGRGKR